MDKETMLEWEKSAYEAGEVESWLIARVALGCPVGIDEALNLPLRRQRQIARMTQRGAARLVALRGGQAGVPAPSVGAVRQRRSADARSAAGFGTVARLEPGGTVGVAGRIASARRGNGDVAARAAGPGMAGSFGQVSR